MESALRIKTKVLTGKRIEITSPGLVEGEIVEILVVPPRRPRRKRRSALEVIQASRGGRIFETAEEADRYLQEERDSWDR